MRASSLRTGPWAVMLAALLMSTCWSAINAAELSSRHAAATAAGAASAEPISAARPLAAAATPCQAADRCCLNNDSPADCASTASRNRGCRSDSSCVPAQDPCSAANNETRCAALGPFCKFDINTFSCRLEAAQHPCAAITTTPTCQAAAGCRVAHVCRDACAACPSCLDAMKAFGAMPPVLKQLEKQNSAGGFQASAFLTGYCHAAAAGVLRASQDDLMAGCSRVAEDVARSPALLSRPAALCKRLGLCHSSCLVDGTSSSSGGGSSSSSGGGSASPVAAPGVTPKDSIDLCSPTGLASGAPKESTIDRSKAREGSVCLSSADCPSGLDCDTFSHSRCWSKCDKETGMDTCLTAGTCVNICARPDIKAVVEDSARRYRPCANASTCAAGEECRKPQFACTMVQCNPLALSQGVDPVQFVPCAEICMAQAPKMLNATFSDSGTKIQVTLNQEAAPMNALCSFVFDAPTSALLGDAATCTTAGNVLTISLAGDVQIRPNRQPLALGDVNALFTSAFGAGSAEGGLPMFSGSLPSVSPCANCSASAINVKLMGPNEIALGCETDPLSAYADVDGTFMRDAPFTPLGPAGFNYVALPPSSALWMIKDLTWSVSSSTNVSTDAVARLVAAANNKTHVWERQSLTIPFDALVHMPEGPLTLVVDLTNIFGVHSASSLTLKKKNASEAPLFQLDHSLRSFTPAGGFKVEAAPLPSGCPGAKVTFKWTSTIPGVDLSDATGSSVVFTPHDLQGHIVVGKAYKVTLTTSYEGSSGSHSESLTLTAAGSPLSVNLTGPSGSIPLKQGGGELVYDGQGSLDPDDPLNSRSQMSFMWSCVNTADLTPCFGRQQDTRFILDTAQLQEGVRYVVSLKVAKGDRSAAASRSFTPGSSQQGLSAELRRSCGVDLLTGAHLPCPPLHNPTDPLTLIALPEFDAPFDMDDMLLEWWYDPVSVPHLMLDDNNTAAGTSLPSLTVLPDALPNGGAITINLNFSLNPDSPKLKQVEGAPAPAAPISSNFSGTSSLTVPLNGPPVCSSPSNECLTLDRSLATFPDSTFKACAVAWSDPEAGPLSYEFGTLSALREQQAVATNVGSCFTFAGLPPGPCTLYGCAVDALGARACQEVDVAVLAPERPVTPSDVDEQLAKLNAELDSRSANGSSTTPASSLVNKAMEVTSLLTSTTKQAVNSVADIVDTTVNGFKSMYDDLKKAFGGFTLSINTGGHGSPERGSRRTAASPKLLMSASSKPSSSSSSSSRMLVAANATTKLLRLMADAGSERDMDQTVSLLTAGEQLASHAPLTPEGGVALLDLYRTTMLASSNANRPLTPQQSNAAANALTRGLDAATSAAAGAPAVKETAQQQQQQQQQQRRHLLVSSANHTKSSMVLLSPDQAFSIIQDGAYRLAAAQKVTLGVVGPPVGNAGVCTSPALLSRSDVDAFTTEFDCSGIDTPATVILPSNFSRVCDAHPDCRATSDDQAVLATYFSPTSRSVPVVMAVVNNSAHLLAEDPAIRTEVISGLLNISLGYSGPAGAFCAGRSIGDVLAQGNGCKAELELPLSNAFDAGKTAACVQLLPNPEAPGRLKPGAIEPVLSVRDTEVPIVSGRAYRNAVVNRAKKAVATCRVARQGLWLVVQFSPLDAADEAHLSSQLSGALGATLGSYELIPGEFSDEEGPLDKKAAVSYTYTFAQDGPSVIASPLDLAHFSSELQRAFLAGTVEAWTDGPDLADGMGALRLSHVVVSNIRPNKENALVADVILTPPSGTTRQQLAVLAQVPPAELLLPSSSLRNDLVDSQRGTAGGGLGAAAGGWRRKVAGGGAVIIGIVIGCVGVLAALLAVAVVVVRRRRTVRAGGRFSNASSDDSEGQARQALSTAGGAPPSEACSDLRSVNVTTDSGAGPVNRTTATQAAASQQQQQHSSLLPPVDTTKLSEAASLASAAVSALKNCGGGGSCNSEAARLAAAAAAALAGANSSAAAAAAAGSDTVRKGAAL